MGKSKSAAPTGLALTAGTNSGSAAHTLTNVASSTVTGTAAAGGAGGALRVPDTVQDFANPSLVARSKRCLAGGLAIRAKILLY